MPLNNTNHLFSLHGTPFRHDFESGYVTKSFNLADLIEPIPDEVYNRQSRCLMSSFAWQLTYGVGNFSCPRTEPYAPIIGVPPEARALDPAWASCEAWYGGLFDREYSAQVEQEISTRDTETHHQLPRHCNLSMPSPLQPRPRSRSRYQLQRLLSRLLILGCLW